MAWIDAIPLPPMGKPEIVVAPVASDRPAQAPARKPLAIATRVPPRENAPGASTKRGLVVDILA
jgi:hypothetical protein